MNTERLIGLSYACEQFHSGQWSRGYRLLSKIAWRPRGLAEKLLTREEFREARYWAAHYMRLARKGMDF